jgi:hypothetical protein
VIVIEEEAPIQEGAGDTTTPQVEVQGAGGGWSATLTPPDMNNNDSEIERNSP